jgi:hypothetical protein
VRDVGISLLLCFPVYFINKSIKREVETPAMDRQKRGIISRRLEFFWFWLLALMVFFVRFVYLIVKISPCLFHFTAVNV